jgi:Holliday junction resolvase-like predicted endonuclease
MDPATDRLSPRRQGDLGELSAMEWLGSQGYGVSFPIGHSPDYDLIAEDGDELLRVQVKTSTRHRNDRWEVMLCTRGGNRSWNGVVKLFSASRCDRLFVLVADGRRWFIPADAIAGGTGVILGGPKYAEFEVGPGRPLPAR